MNWDFVREVGLLRWSYRTFIRQLYKRVLHREIVMRLPHGGRFIISSDSKSAAEAYITNADIDWGSEALFARFADADSDAFDIGSHIGYYACYLSPLVRSAYAFEPDPSNLHTLSRNAALAKNIHVVREAVSSQSGKADFYSHGNSAVGSLVPSEGPSISVNVTTVDNFIAEHPGVKPTLIKIDVEGHDFSVLQGMEQTVASIQPLVLTECDYNSELAELCNRWNYLIFA